VVAVVLSLELLELVVLAVAAMVKIVTAPRALLEITEQPILAAVAVAVLLSAVPVAQVVQA
jgi:hypothetical protein